MSTFASTEEEVKNEIEREWGSTQLVCWWRRRKSIIGEPNWRHTVQEWRKGDAKTTAEQFKVLWASQHCLPSSFINILLEYLSTLVQLHPPRQREINRALYHPDTQCIAAFVIVVTWISSVTNWLPPSIPLPAYSCLLLILTTSFSVKGLKRDRAGLSVLGFRLWATMWSERSCDSRTRSLTWAPQPCSHLNRSVNSLKIGLHPSACHWYGKSMADSYREL